MLCICSSDVLFFKVIVFKARDLFLYKERRISQQLQAWEYFLYFSAAFNVLEVFRGLMWSLPLARYCNLNLTVMFSDMENGRNSGDVSENGFLNPRKDIDIYKIDMLWFSIMILEDFQPCLKYRAALWL